MNNIRRETTPEGIAILIFDRPNSSVNIFDLGTLEELNTHIDQVADAKGLVILSAKDSIFVAGADLHSFKKMSAAEINQFIGLGQEVFSKIAALPIPTVAAVHGAALGGGYEVCLACDYRLGSPDRATKLGLPETQLGILPAWGGSTRLPRLIGVPGALDIILGGKTVSARHALKLGMIDEVVTREYLRPAALQWLAKGKRPRQISHSAPVNTVIDAVIAPKARAAIQKKTRGHYPAVKRALEVILQGASDWHEESSLARERAAIIELVELPSTKNLLRLFFLQERAKKLSVLPRNADAAPEAAIEHVTVIGAGLMGSGIAQWLSARGLRTTLRDIDPSRVASGMANVAKLYAESVKRRLFTATEARRAMELISPVATEVPLRHTDLVIEAAVEKMEVKKTIFRRLDTQTRPEAILATNTSALSISELAGATQYPERVVGLHFFNPVHKMQLVEVIRGPKTAPELVQKVIRFVQKIGKLPVLVNDSPGFLVNRILLPYMIEAGALVEAGVGVSEIDEAMLDFGMPMGPLRLIDEVGVDISEDVAVTLAAAFPDRLKIPPILSKMIDAGWLGRKTGQGFYLHRTGEDPVLNPAIEELQTGKLTISKDELQRRMVLLMVNESARCLEERIIESPADADFAMVMGTGFAPFRGGPLRHADSVGTSEVAAQLLQLSETAGPHYAPCEFLRQLNGKPFYEE